MADRHNVIPRPPSGNTLLSHTLLSQLASRPLPDELVEGVAKAIYETHWAKPAPPWENASANVRGWVREQATSALVHLSRLAGGGR